MFPGEVCGTCPLREHCVGGKAGPASPSAFTRIASPRPAAAQNEPATKALLRRRAGWNARSTTSSTWACARPAIEVDARPTPTLARRHRRQLQSPRRPRRVCLPMASSGQGVCDHASRPRRRSHGSNRPGVASTDDHRPRLRCWLAVVPVFMHRVARWHASVPLPQPPGAPSARPIQPCRAQPAHRDRALQLGRVSAPTTSR